MAGSSGRGGSSGGRGGSYGGSAGSGGVDISSEQAPILIIIGSLVGFFLVLGFTVLCLQIKWSKKPPTDIRVDPSPRQVETGGRDAVNLDEVGNRNTVLGIETWQRIRERREEREMENWRSGRDNGAIYERPVVEYYGTTGGGEDSSRPTIPFPTVTETRGLENGRSGRRDQREKRMRMELNLST